MRWPFGPPHLTLKPSKTKNIKKKTHKKKQKRKQERNKEGLEPTSVFVCGLLLTLVIHCMLFSFFYCAFFVLSLKVPQPPLSTRILCFFFCS